MAKIHSILKQYWGFDQFRPLQEDIIQAVLQNKDTLALMPTGGGKSICYQIPAMAKPGVCLVISPLIALMKDQVNNLNKKSITAFAVYSGMTRKEVMQTFRVVSESNCKFLFVSPERLETDLFREYLLGFGINLIAVDEAHCISQWGYDFRPPYLRIAALREELPTVPILALTASATPEVQKDICEKLNFNNATIFRQSFARPNLSYSCRKVDAKINKLIEILQKVKGSSIVYCKSRKRCKEICELLRLQNISADYYHAGLSQTERNKRQDEWLQNTTRVIVCTNAFGMGIDKANVRTVIHADVTDCLENYYQEAGRAGRDGQKAYAVLLYDDNDVHNLDEWVKIRFPDLDDIKNVYQSIANYLQLPVNSGANEYFSFDIADFLRKFKLLGYTTIYAIKSLEQEGYLQYSDSIFIPSSIVFTTDKYYLTEIEKTKPALSETIKTLLRTYEGIFDQQVPVSEIVLASLMKTTVEKVKNELTALHQLGVIDYTPQKDSPQIYFPVHRIAAEDIQINFAALEKRKEQFIKRIRQMKKYINNNTNCRSTIIGNYFGDTSLTDCGICDNCLRQRKTILSKDDFNSIHFRIVNIVKYKPIHTKDLLLKLNEIQKEKTWKVLSFLQAEKKIAIDETGIISLQ